MFTKIQKIVFLSFLCFWFGNQSQAQVQQPPNFKEVGYSSQYYFQQTLINPAFVGSDEQMNFSVLYPLKTIGSNKPQQLNVLFQDNFNSFEGGYGLSLSYQNTGIKGDKENFYLVNGIISGGFEFSENWVGRAGLTIGAIHYTNVYRSGTQKGTQGSAFFKVNLDAGILLTNGNFSIGFSVMQSNEPEFSFTDRLSDEEQIALVNARVNNKFLRAVYFQMRYNMDINDEAVIITPTFLLSNRQQFANNTTTVSNNNNRLKMELGANALIKNLVLVGIHSSLMNSPYAMSVMAGAQINNKFQVALSYDFPKQSSTTYRNLELSTGVFF